MSEATVATLDRVSSGNISGETFQDIQELSRPMPATFGESLQLPDLLADGPLPGWRVELHGCPEMV
jgi:hypothetical protein